ncbi:MAG: alpha/beta hydrolase [Actinomycetaceae bacterium]
MTWSSVLDWKASSLGNDVDSLGSARDTLQGISEDLDGMTSPDGWTGDAADAAGSTRRTIGFGAQSIVYEVSLVRSAVAEAEDTVAAVERKVGEATSLAQAKEVSIGSTGDVTDVKIPPASFADEAEAAEYERERKEAVEAVAALVREVLLLADSADTTLVAVLNSAEGDQLDSGTTNLAAAADIGEQDGDIDWPEPPTGGTPAENAEWWDGLDPSQRQEILDEHPDLVGNRDGIPAVARDEANRNRLDGELTDAEQQFAEAEAALEEFDGAFMGPGMDQLYLDALGRVEDAQARVDSIIAVQNTLALEIDGDGAPRQLLLLDTESGDRVHAAVAIGNVDTADHVTGLTPGFTTTVDDSLASYDSHMLDLRDTMEGELDRYGHTDETVATVAWLGYDAPQWDGVIGSNSVLTQGTAERAGEDLANFYGGINASRPDDPHLTAMGHSYGSTTLGHALQRPGTGVDDVVFMSSPGIGTDSISDLHVPQDSVYYVENNGDKIADSGIFGEDLTTMDGVHQLATDDRTVDGRGYDGTTGHSSVFDDGSTAQYNSALVAAGLEEHTIQETMGEGFWDWIGSGFA